jgi:hypothetical protein
MKTGKVKVGTKFGTEHVQVECNIQLPENVDDMLKLARGSGDFVVQMFTRGWRIWEQEQSGARDFVEQSTVEQRKDTVKFAGAVQAVIDKADPTAPPKRSGRPAAPREVTITPEQIKALKGDPQKFAELLAAQGIKVSITA